MKQKITWITKKRTEAINVETHIHLIAMSFNTHSNLLTESDTLLFNNEIISNESWKLNDMGVFI